MEGGLTHDHPGCNLSWPPHLWSTRIIQNGKTLNFLVSHKNNVISIGRAKATTFLILKLDKTKCRVLPDVT